MIIALTMPISPAAERLISEVAVRASQNIVQQALHAAGEDPFLTPFRVVSFTTRTR